MFRRFALAILVVVISSVASAQFGSSLVVAPLAEWLSTSVLSKPELAKSFSFCQSIVARYEDAIIERRTADAGAAETKSQQQVLATESQQLADHKQAVRNITCLKQFFQGLEIEGAASGQHRDELMRLNGKLANLDERAKARFDDLTDEGLRRLALSMSLQSVGPQALGAEIDAVTHNHDPSPGYLACLLPRDWVSWFFSGFGCSTPLLDSLLASTAQEMKLR
jgi:hypothetical protein